MVDSVKKYSSLSNFISSEKTLESITRENCARTASNSGREFIVEHNPRSLFHFPLSYSSLNDLRLLRTCPLSIRDFDEETKKEK